MIIKKEQDGRGVTVIVSWWNKYCYFIKCATCGTLVDGNEMDYWREKLFSKFVTFLLPICCVALIPGVLVGVFQGYPFIAGFDLFAVLAIAFTVLNKKIDLGFRKLFLFFMLYCLAIVLMVCLGDLGPGNLYLLAITFMVALTFPKRLAYWGIVINIVISAGFGLVIALKLFDIPFTTEYNLGSWIAVSSNLIFLSWVSVLIISSTLKGLEQTIQKELRLKEELVREGVERSRHIKLLKDSESHFRTLFFLNPTPMWVLDRVSLMFLEVNEAAIRNYGYTNKEFLAMSVNDIKLETDRTTLLDDLKRNTETGMPVHLVTRHRRKNREEFEAEVVFNAILFKGKDAILTITRDISERASYIKAIECQNKQLHEIAYIQSHHVRAPLARIMGLVDLIIRDAAEKPEPELLIYLRQSTNDLDLVIREVMSNTLELQTLEKIGRNRGYDDK
jgi:PAS domain S-box-containing protein